MFSKLLHKCSKFFKKPTKLYLFGYPIEDISKIELEVNSGEFVALTSFDWEIFQKGELLWKT